MYSREPKTYVQTNTCVQTLAAALLTVTKGGNGPNPQGLTDGRTTRRRSWKAEPHRGALAAVGSNGARIRGTAQMDHENVMLSGRSQTLKATHYGCHADEVSRVRGSAETEGESAQTGAGCGEEQGVAANRPPGSFRADEDVLETEVGDGCRAL